MPANRATFNQTPSYEAAEAIPAYRLVTIANDSGVVKASLCGDNEAPDGVALEAAAIGEPVPVLPWTPGHQVVAVANEAIAVGATVFTAADGKVTDTDGGSDVDRGIAASLTTGADQEIAVYIL